MLSSPIGLPSRFLPTEYERKLLVEPRHSAAVLAFLRAHCRVSAAHPTNHVVSLYYDTRRLDALAEKLNSDRYKTKVRLRWYEQPGSGVRSPVGFVEVKRRLGAMRDKLRAPTTLDADQLAAMKLDDRRLLALPAGLREHGIFAVEALEPALVVRYRRWRFVEPATGSRISLDTEIRAADLHPRLGPGALPVVLDRAVVEVKNGSGEIPEQLRLLVAMGARQASFSKYSSCFQAAVGRAA